MMEDLRKPWATDGNIVTDADGDEIAGAFGPFGGKREAEIANLMAAAPELLEALENLAKWGNQNGTCRHCVKSFRLHHPGCPYGVALQAINKAKGGN